MKTRRLKISEGLRVNLSRFPNFAKTGNIAEMKRKYYPKDSLLVQCGGFIYNVSSEPYIYYDVAR